MSGPNCPCTSPAWWIEAIPVAQPIASARTSGPASGPSGLDHLGQRRPGDELGDQVGLAALDTGVEDAGHTERRNVAGDPGLRDEPVPGGRVVRPAGTRKGRQHRLAVHALGQEDVLPRHVRPGEVVHPAREPVAADATGIAWPQGGDVGHPASSRIAGVWVVSGLYLTQSPGFNSCQQGNLKIGRTAAPRSRLVIRPREALEAQHDLPEPPPTCARSRDVTEFPAGIGHNRGAPSVTRKAP